MAHVNEIFLKTLKLRQDIDRLLKLTNYDEYGDLSSVEVDELDAEQLFLWDELNYIMNKLQDASDRMEYLSFPIKETSCLRKNEIGRYETAKGYELTSGTRIEALISDCRYHDALFWVRTSVEHDGTDYYLVKNKNIPLEGLCVRVRRAVV